MEQEKNLKEDLKSKIFDRQMRIEDWNQELLAKQTALCLGVGGLGSCVSLNLARLGLKKIYLLDYDVVEVHNLNRQLLFSIKDIGRSKVDAAKENLAVHNVGETELVTFHMNALTNFDKVVDLVKDSDIIFNMIDVGDYFDLAIQSLCLKLEKTLIQAGTFSGSLSLDIFRKKGKPCYLCLTDGLDKDIVDRLKPEIITSLKDISFVPRNKNPVGQSNVFLCSTCSNLMVAAYIYDLFGNENMSKVQRVIFYLTSFETVNFSSPPRSDCPYCSKE